MWPPGAQGGEEGTSGGQRYQRSSEEAEPEEQFAINIVFLFLFSY
jgi:hypothetical protein